MSRIHNNTNNRLMAKHYDLLLRRCRLCTWDGRVCFSFHNFDFAPGKDFVQKKSHRLLLRKAVQRAENKPSPVQGRHICRNPAQNISKLRPAFVQLRRGKQERHIPSSWSSREKVVPNKAPEGWRTP